LIFKTANEIASKITNNLARNNGLTGIQSGSVISTLINSFSVELEQGNRMAADLSNNLFLSTASGTYLDAISTLFGLKRLPGKRKTFIDGIRIYTSDGLALSTYLNIGFFTDLIVSSTSLGGRFRVQPPATVAHLNAGYIDLQAYIEDADAAVYFIDSINKFTKTVHTRVKVTNLIETDINTSAEDDTSFRRRISKAMNGLQFGTNDALFLAAYNLPEVANVSIVENENGPGTVSMYIIPKDKTSTAAAVYAVKRAITGVSPLGIIIDVLPAELVYVRVAVNIETENDLNVNYAKNIIKAVLKQEIDNMNFKSALSLDKIEKIIKAIFPEDTPSVSLFEISKTDTFGIQYAFEEVYKYQLLNKESFCLNPTNPVSVTIGSNS